ncbi:MAG TPA: helix-turn-helix transcriptional regulator [Thermopolyspora sp.]
MPATLTPRGALESEEHEIERAISENVSILLHRSRMSATGLAREIGMSKATMNRKIAMGPWHYVDLARIARFYAVTVEELVGGLPSPGDWDVRWVDRYAIRDSNPEPADLVPARARRLRLIRGPRIPEPSTLPPPKLLVA